MNIIEIWSPRWHDRKILIAPWKVGEDNEIRVAHHSFPEPLYMSGRNLRQYPTTPVERKNRPTIMMYAVPIEDFITLSERNDIVNKAKGAFA